MKKHQKAGMFLSLAVAVMMASGCGAKKMETTEAPKGPETQEAVKAEPAPTAVSQEKYVVKDGDTLWAIANQGDIYSDSFQWPLIFKADRDQIQDPDKITPGQVLVIQRGHSAEQVEHARRSASDTPAFVHHDEPRTTLPVDYF